MENENISVFKTSDIPLVAFLRLEGYTVFEILKVNEYKCEFEFHDVNRQMLMNFNTDQCVVEPRAFASTMHQQMKSAKVVLKDK